MFSRNKQQLRRQGDDELRAEIMDVQDQLLRLRRVELQDADAGSSFAESVKLQQAKFNLLYNEARHRGTKAAVISQAITRID
ncbi:DUF2508 family protein [Lapidilactobacillus wuchangensis]|uniref:DUF2508 family protein n=1 Tax=Lapidilactobacillus wuchangensis TaxID=2486001 RepID=UPI000F77C1CB|nr:DUF2508 family protein [Lapidilactobacillus wuchangensis]